MEEGPARRLQVLRAHLTSPSSSSETRSSTKPLDVYLTGAFAQEENSYCVVLPEHLTPHGPWLVRRSALEDCLETVILSLHYLTQSFPQISFDPRFPFQCRNALSPDRLIDTFHAPDDHVHTLYDNLDNSIAKYPDVSTLIFGLSEYKMAVFLFLIFKDTRHYRLSKSVY